MSLTPDQQANGYLNLGDQVVDPKANNGAGAVVSRYTGSNPTMGTSPTPATPPPPPAPTTPPSVTASPTPDSTTAATGQPATPAVNPNPAADPNYSGTGSNSILDLFKNLPTSYPTAADEASIRQSIADTMQGSVDAINKNYNDLLTTQVLPNAAQNTGATRAAAGRSGLLASDYGNAQQQKASDRNQAVEDQAQAERESQLNTITNEINQRAEAEIQAKQAAALGNTEQLATYTQQAQTAARQNIKDLASIGATLTPEMKASLLKDSGYDPMTFDAIFNANRQISQQAQYEYINLGNGTVLRTGKLANGQAVPNQTFQYQLGPNDEFQVTQNGTPVIVSKQGNEITGVKVAPGFQAGSLGSKFTPVYSNGNVSLLNTLTGQITSGDGSATAPAGGFRTDRNNNPTAMTTDVAAQSGLVEGQDYVQGDPFTTSSGQTLYTAKLLGDPIQTTIKAIDQGGFTTANGMPRWDYLNKLPAQDQTTIQNWASATTDQKTQVVKDMYKQEGGSGSLNGDSTSTKAFDPTDPTDALAATYLQGSTIPKGNGKSTASAGTVTARANEIAAQLGLVQPGEAFDQTSLKADQKANMKVLLDQVPQRAQIQANLDAADSNFQMLTQFMQQHGLNASNIPLANQLQQKINSGGLAGADATGAQAAMNSALAGLATEYAQILARGGQRNETVDKEAAQLIPGNLSPAELQDVVNYIKSEGQNVLKSKDAAIATARNSFGNPTSSSSTPTSGTTSSGISYSIEP